MSLWSLLRMKGPSGFSAASTAEEVTQGLDGTGLTAVVTGASSGIGYETARVLALRNVHVVMGVRNMKAAAEVKDALTKQYPAAKIDAIELDLSSMASVRRFASTFSSSGLQLNILINNAGIMMTPFMLSKDRIELQFATNHIGHFLLTSLLLETMKKTAQKSKKEGRILNVSSRRHKLSYPEGIRFDKINDHSGYDSLSAYGQSKLANVLHANELARRLKAEGAEVTANSVHPGPIATNLFRHNGFLAGGCLLCVFVASFSCGAEILRSYGDKSVPVSSRRHCQYFWQVFLQKCSAGGSNYMLWGAASSRSRTHREILCRLQCRRGEHASEGPANGEETMGSEHGLDKQRATNLYNRVKIHITPYQRCHY